MKPIVHCLQIELLRIYYNGKDSFITQDRNEQIKGVKVEATFSRGHISLIQGPNPKELVPNERYGHCLSTVTLWVVVGQLVRSP